MEPRADRLTAYQRRILGVLLQHHQAAGWDVPLARGELLARLQGWGYGRQLTRRRGIDGDATSLAYTGIDRSRVGARAYQAGQTALKRALPGLFGQWLIQVGADNRPGLFSAEAQVAEMAEDLREPEAAYRRFLATGLKATYNEFLARRQAALVAWQTGRGRAPFKVQRVALTGRGRVVAERLAVGVPTVDSPSMVHPPVEEPR